ncbi:MAG: PilT/PilU family type 4a pilus ATPase [Armatimonadetes bacterium]|nr:PilT/PilU family type 4a pilus ATPase [Armatimonadota bacterium]
MRTYASADELLQICYERDASDIHIVSHEPPTLRLYGRLVRLEEEFGELSPQDTERLFREVAPTKAIHELERVRTADFGYTHKNARFRVAAYYQKGAVAINFRLIPYKLRSFEDIGLPDHLKQLLWRPRGLVLITGPTGSGKTTTLATMTDYINTNRDTHIITIEDPIEYYHEPKASVVSQREVGTDVPTFDEGVVRALRMDPDVILVGEMRDLKTIEAAIRAAETGHLVFSTVHTTGAARTVERIVDVFPTEQQEQIRVQLSTNLVAIISQLLLPRIDRPGRVSAYEIMISNPAIGHMIRDRKIHSIVSAIQTGQQLGMMTLDHHLQFLYQHKIISREEMYRVAQEPEELANKLGEPIGDLNQIKGVSLGV